MVRSSSLRPRPLQMLTTVQVAIFVPCCRQWLDCAEYFVQPRSEVDEDGHFGFLFSLAKAVAVRFGRTILILHFYYDHCV